MPEQPGTQHTPVDAAGAVETGLVVEGRLIKESTNMVRYNIVETADRLAVGCVYVSKDALPHPYPAKIEIRIK
jgi:hypothetical protein